jgi:hypothetical protein
MNSIKGMPHQSIESDVPSREVVSGEWGKGSRERRETGKEM